MNGYLSKGRLMSRAAWKFNQRDVTRGLRAFAAAGIKNVRVEILPDKTLRYTPMNEPQEAPQPNEWDKALGTPPAKIRS
jgi:hypothetical protein